jgi:hypothetical protein
MSTMTFRSSRKAMSRGIRVFRIQNDRVAIEE